MTTKKDKPKEVEIIDKVFSYMEDYHPGEARKALKEYNETEEAKIAQDDSQYQRGFLAYFILEKEVKGLTPMEHAYNLNLLVDYFNSEERRIIKNFLEHINSFFEITKASIDKKDYHLKELFTGKKYLVKTLDLTGKLEPGEIIKTIIVRKKGREYFFYGTIHKYGAEIKESIQKIRMDMEKKLFGIE